MTNAEKVSMLRGVLAVMIVIGGLFVVGNIQNGPSAPPQWNIKYPVVMTQLPPKYWLDCGN
ncbi:hypothetical protein ACQPW1_19515 [Nocardia sp. CA-128927]|uniref:hypothetical protein n=1 Tax=Nocardia sp. CA-128927 TaxID=3239975 RepID=UPI003D984F8D